MADKAEKKSTIRKLLEKEIPGVRRAKEYVDERLTKRVVEPLAKRGYEDLGAAIATVPSFVVDTLVPNDVAEAGLLMAAPVAKGIGKAYKVGKEAVPAAIEYAEKRAPKLVKKLKEKLPEKKPDLPEEYLTPDSPIDVDKEINKLAEQIKYEHDEFGELTEPVMKPAIARKLAKEALGLDDTKTSVAEVSRYWGDPLYQKYSQKYRSKLTPKQLEELDNPTPAKKTNVEKSKSFAEDKVGTLIPAR